MISLQEYFMWLEALSSCALSGNKLALDILREHDKTKDISMRMLIIYKYKKRIEKESNVKTKRRRKKS